MKHITSIMFILLIIGLVTSVHLHHGKPFYFTVIPNDSKEVHVSIRDGEFYVSFYRGKEEPYGTDTQRVINTCLGGLESGAMLSACNGMDRFEVDSACAAKVIYQILDGATCENGKLLMY